MKNFADILSSFITEIVDYAVKQGKVKSKIKKILKHESFNVDEITNLAIKTDSIDIYVKTTTESVLGFELWGEDVDDLQNIEIKQQTLGDTFDFSAVALGNHNFSLRIFVPKKEFNISLFSENGDAMILNNSFQKLKIITENGDVVCKKSTASALQLQTKNGDSKFSSCLISELKVITENGDIICKKITADTVQLRSENGDITIEDCDIKNPIQAESKRGDVIQKSSCPVTSNTFPPSKL